MERGSKETIKPALMAGLGLGRPVSGTSFIVNPAEKRLMPYAAALREFMINQGQAFLPTFSQTMPGLVPSGRSARCRRRARLRTHSPGPERLL